MKWFLVDNFNYLLAPNLAQAPTPEPRAAISDLNS